jgi:hypothetical protein
MPDPLKEARGGYNACYTSAISRAMGAQEAAGFMRVIENLKEIVAVAQDTSIFEPRNFDRAVPAIADPIFGRLRNLTFTYPIGTGPLEQTDHSPPRRRRREGLRLRSEFRGPSRCRPNRRESLTVQPINHSLIGAIIHEGRDDVGVEDDHSSKRLLIL